MSRWAPKPADATSESDKEKGFLPLGGTPVSHQPVARSYPRWTRIVPFFLSAVFFLSAFFAIFSPLPLIFENFRRGRRWAVLAALTNSALVYFAAGTISISLYLSSIVTLAFVLSALLRRGVKVEKTVALTLGSMVLAGALVIGVHSRIRQVNPLDHLKAEVSQSVDFLTQNMKNGPLGVEPGTPDGESPGNVEEWKRQILVEFPSVLAVFALILVWANLAVVLRANPGQVRERLGLGPDFLRRWRSPDWMVWPTILSGFFLLVEVPVASEIAMNVFKFMMAIYGLQGLSVLSFFLEAWNVRGAFRGAILVASVLFMMPLVLSLGFFDLWFDFRSKIRQS